jgi:Yip1 domain
MRWPSRRPVTSASFRPAPPDNQAAGSNLIQQGQTLPSKTRSLHIMFRALQLIFIPEKIWQKFLLSRPSWLLVFFLHFLPLILITSSAEAYALTRWGERRGVFGHVAEISPQLAWKYGATQFGLALVVVLFGAKIIQWITSTFNNRSAYGSCFLAVAYGLAPFYLLRLLDAIPALNTWICWAFGIVCSLSSLYHGLPRMLMLEQTRAFGTYLLSLLVVVLLTGSAHLLATAVLHGRLVF